MKTKNGFLLTELLVALSIFLVFVFFITKYQLISSTNSFLAVKKAKALNVILNYINEDTDKIKQSEKSEEFKVLYKNINCVLGLNNIAIYLKSLLGPSFIINTNDFKLREISVEFDFFNRKKSEVKIVAGQ